MKRGLIIVVIILIAFIVVSLYYLIYPNTPSNPNSWEDIYENLSFNENLPFDVRINVIEGSSFKINATINNFKYELFFRVEGCNRIQIEKKSSQEGWVKTKAMAGGACKSDGSPFDTNSVSTVNFTSQGKYIGPFDEFVMPSPIQLDEEGIYRLRINYWNKCEHEGLGVYKIRECSDGYYGYSPEFEVV